MGSWRSIAGIILVASIALAWLNAWLKQPVFKPNMVANKVVCICGASSGLGEEMAYQYSRLGARLILAARRKGKLEKVKEKCKSLGSPETHIVVADFAKPSDALNLHQVAKNIFGVLDILVLNHVQPTFGPWRDLSLAHSKIHDVLEVNFVSYIQLATLFTPELIESGGTIAVVSSMAGIMGVPLASIYSGSKHALHGFFDAYRVELRMQGVENITVFTGVLGPIATDMLISALPPNSTDAYGLPISSVEDAVEAVIKHIAFRTRHMYFPFYIRYLHYFNLLLPDLVEDMTIKSYFDKKMSRV